MKTYVISLDRTPQRYEKFCVDNPHIMHQRFSAVDGDTVPAAALVQQGIFNAQNPPAWVSGAVGCFMSHHALWKLCVELGESLTVCEDDAILSRDFEKNLDKMHNTLLYDMVVWGYNLDVSVGYWMPRKFTSVVSRFDMNVVRASKENYLAGDVDSYFYKLAHCFGTPCYSISPLGAQKLIQLFRNISHCSVQLPLLGENHLCSGVDGYLNAIYPILDAYVAVPPSAITMNDQTATTILGR